MRFPSNSAIGWKSPAANSQDRERTVSAGPRKYSEPLHQKIVGEFAERYLHRDFPVDAEFDDVGSGLQVRGCQGFDPLGDLFRLPGVQSPAKSVALLLHAEIAGLTFDRDQPQRRA